MREKEVEFDRRVQMIEKAVVQLPCELHRLRKIRPDCAEFKEMYDECFKNYIKQVDRVIKKNNETKEILQDLAHEPLLTPKTIEEYIAHLKRNYQKPHPFARRLNVIKRELQKRMRHQRHESFQELRAHSEDLIEKLRSYENLLNQLRKPTHEWDSHTKKIKLEILSSRYEPPFDLDRRETKHETKEYIVLKSRFCSKCEKVEILSK